MQLLAMRRVTPDDRGRRGRSCSSSRHLEDSTNERQLADRQRRATRLVLCFVQADFVQIDEEDASEVKKFACVSLSG
jgi:hypothetical protein